MYTRVYAPNGEPFDVTRDIADNLVLNQGWTQTAPERPVEPEPEPVEDEQEEPAPKRRRKRTSADADE